MKLSEDSDLKSQLKALNDANISEDVFRKLSENAFAALTDGESIQNHTALYNSKPDVIKGVYAILLRASAEFGRHALGKDAVRSFLTDECKFNSNRANVYADVYDKHKRDLEHSLGLIGTHLPHVTDVKWKIDYIVKTNNLDQVEGPLFRVSLITSRFDGGKTVTEDVNFTCNSQELQDLIYKLKDAARHCQWLVAEH